ncbi:MAG: TetR/AcrR family transcriptional regulator [Lentisphaeria bacterium]|nr:TetR/AcrR family transcriptional regulator [Lentisphaeria bacterium]
MSSKGATTRERILEAACELFSEKGFVSTTTQDICGLAQANIAGVNYHFRSKENLYREAWVHLDRLAMDRWTELIDSAESAEEKLCQFIRFRVNSVLSDGMESRFPRIMHREMGQPSALHEELMENYMRKRRKWFLDLVREIVGGALDKRQERMAGFCIHSPLIHLIEIHNRPEHPHRHRCHSVRKDSEALAETLCTFALAGLRELTRQHGQKEE